MAYSFKVSLGGNVPVKDFIKKYKKKKEKEKENILWIIIYLKNIFKIIFI